MVSMQLCPLRNINLILKHEVIRISGFDITEDCFSTSVSENTEKTWTGSLTEEPSPTRRSCSVEALFHTGGLRGE